MRTGCGGEGRVGTRIGRAATITLVQDVVVFDPSAMHSAAWSSCGDWVLCALGGHYV